MMPLILLYLALIKLSLLLASDGSGAAVLCGLCVCVSGPILLWPRPALNLKGPSAPGV